jgi:hypothetical protein
MTCTEQHDDHIWLTLFGTAWAIQAIEWPVIYFWRGYAPNLEYLTVEFYPDDDFKDYCDVAVSELLK